jgi:type IV pilus assembly protein PilC
MIIIIALLLLAFYFYLGLKRPNLAFLTCPLPALFSIAYFSSGIADTDAITIAIVIMLLIVPATFGSILVAKRQDDEEDKWPRVCAKWGLAILFLFLLAICLGVMFPPGLIIFPVFVTSLICYLVTSRRVVALNVLSTIGVSMRQNLPLVMALETAAENRQDQQGRVLRSISKWLGQGYSLSEAIKRGFPKCPSDIAAMITVAERIDQLPQAIESVKAELIERSDESKKIRPIDPVYPLVVLLCAFLIISGLAIFIVPTFAEVLSDMSDGEASLPVPTQLLLNFAYILVRNRGNFLLFAATITGGVGFWIYIRFRPRRPERPYFLSRSGDFLKWHIPVMHWFEMNYSMLRIAGLMKVSLGAGFTVDQVIRNALNLDINYYFRKRLSQWLDRIEKGDNISESALRSGMPKQIAWAFDDKVNQGNTPQILEMLEEFYRSNYNYRLNIARSVLCPCVVVMLGATVGFVVYAMFLPMVAMITYTAESVMP